MNKIMNCKVTRLLSLFMVMFTMFSVSAFAASSYYSKVTVKAVGAGKVYVKYNAADNNPAYATEVSATSGGQSSQNHKYYLYAQADEGNTFVGWYSDEACSGGAVSTNAAFEVTVNATSTDSGSPTAETYYAKFVEAGAPILGYSEARVYVNLSAGTYKNETLTTVNVVDAITYESSNENVATVAADGTVTVKKNGTCSIKAKSGTGEGAYILTVIDDVAAGITQIGNGDFENWSGATSSNHAPDNWNSFETAEGSFAGFSKAQQVQMVEGGRPGSDGFYCADIWSRSVLGVIAQGNLTVGCVNAGAMSASDKGNYNYSKTSDPSKSETLSKVPTAIRFWAKFEPAKANAQHPNAHMEAVVHDNHNYITYSDPSYESDEEKSTAIAKARLDFPTTNGEWAEFVVPFERTKNAADGQLHIIINLATNADPGQGQAGDHLYVDDVELLYETEYDEVPVVKGSGEYGTFCAPFEVNVPYGLTAYTVDGLKANNLTLDLTALNGTIPANTPVVLAGNKEIALTAYGVSAPAAAETGLLTGVYEDTSAPVGSYVLQNLNDVLGFYQVAAGQQPTVKAYRAYLTVPNSDAKAFFFTEEDATSIESIQNSTFDIQNDEAIYNLAGQRVQKLQRGINIVNGKKMLK